MGDHAHEWPKRKPFWAAPHALPREKVAREHATFHSRENALLAGDSLVDENFNLNPAVLSPPSFSLVRGCCSVFTHRARCHDVPNRHVTLLHQASNHRFSAVLTQFRIDLSAAGRVSIARYFDDIPSEALGSFCEFLEFLLILRRDTAAADLEWHGGGTREGRLTKCSE